MTNKTDQKKRRKTSADEKQEATSSSQPDKDVQRKELNKRINRLCKSKHTLLRRAYDLADSCSQQVYVVIYDPELDRLTQYTSDGDFNVDSAKDLLRKHSLLNRRHYMGLRTYVGRNFKRLVTPEEHPDLFLTTPIDEVEESKEQPQDNSIREGNSLRKAGRKETIDTVASGATGGTKQQTGLRMQSSTRLMGSSFKE